MAIQLCSEDSSSILMSPRISFSEDVSPADIVPIEQQNIRINSSSSGIDFDFCVSRDSFDYESSSADELFLDGKILPIEIKRRMGTQRQAKLKLPPPPPPPPQEGVLKNTKNKKYFHIWGPILSSSSSSSSSDEQKQSSKPWKFRRSSSLSCGSAGLCPLPLLSRSNSTGSSSPISKPHYKKFASSSSSSSSSSSASAIKQSQYLLPASNHQKPPLKKFMSNTNGMRINPVLNIPPASLFGLSSIFSGGKDKNKKK